MTSILYGRQNTTNLVGFTLALSTVMVLMLTGCAENENESESQENKMIQTEKFGEMDDGRAVQ